MKPKIKWPRLLLCFQWIASLGILFSPGVPVVHAGLTLEMNVIRYDQSGYYFYPNLNTNNTAPIVPFGDYYITSSGVPTNGSSAFYHFDGNGFNQTGGGSYGYGDFNSMLHELTNGNWTIFVTNTVTTNVYHFTVTANITSNSLPLVAVTFPPNGATGVTNQPTFTWQGPANYSNLVVYYFNGGETLPVAQTSLPCPRLLYQGINSVTVHYDNYSTTAVVSSTPLDGLLHPISSWVSTTHFQNYISSQFTVDTVDTSGTSHTLVAHYAWDDTNEDGTASGADTSGNGYDMDFGGGYGGQGGVDSTTDSETGARAIQFHDGDGGSAGYVGWSTTPSGLLNALSGSFSVSCWIKTSQNYNGWDQDPAYYGAGIISADNSGLANDVIPLALTGSKIGFNTGGDEDVTLNSSASVNDGNYHHIVVTRNQLTGQKIIYIDGVLDSFSSGTTNRLDDPQLLTIGALSDANESDASSAYYYNGYDGELDDVQIYSGVLSSGDVANLFANPGSTVANGGGNGFGGHSIVARYDFEETNSSGMDSSGHGNDSNCGGGDGTENSNDTFSTDAAVGTYSRDFLGHTFICFASAADSFSHLTNAFSGSFSVSAWVKTTQSYNGDDDPADFGASLLFAQENNTDSTIPLALTGSKVAIGVNDHNGNNTTLHSQTSVNDGQYHQIAVTRNQANGVLKVYVDGNLEGAASGPANRLYIPSIIGLGGYFNDYNGLLDDVQIYSGVLSDTDVASLYASPGTTIPDVNGAGGPVVHYDFDEGTVLATDVSGNLNNVIHAGNFGGSGPSISADAAAGAGSVSFDGGSYLTAPATLLPTLAGDFTVSLWLKTSQSFGSEGDFAWNGAVVIGADSPNPFARDLIPVALTGGQVAFNVGDDTGDNTLNSSATVNDDFWHHVVVTRNQATGNRQIFIDGTLDSSQSAATGLLNDPVLLTIGCKSDATDPNPASPDYKGSNGYEGLLDDVQVYPRVLTPGEVSFLHQNPGAIIGNSNLPDTTPVSVDLTLDIYREQDPTFGDFFIAFPGINSITPAATGTTTNVVESPNGKFHGEVNAGNGDTYSYILSSYSDLMNELTNGLWTLYIKKGLPDERQFHFSVTVVGLTTNLLSAVKIIAPTNGATGVAPNTPFLWLGPSNYSTLNVSKQNADNSGYSGTSLAVNATNWPSPPVLAAGTNRFDITYVSNDFTGITFSLPVDDASTTVSNWVTHFNLHSTAESIFVVSSGPLPITLVKSVAVGTNFQFQFLSQSGFTHYILYRTNLALGSWKTNSTVNGDGTLKTISVPFSLFSPSKQGFIRVWTQ